jgi:hypothetical protein
VTLVVDFTLAVFTVKETIVLPAATVTEDGGVAEVELLPRMTVTPPEGATEVNVTVPITKLPPVTVVGLSVIDFSAGGVMARLAD